MRYNLNFYIDFLIIVESFKEVFIIIKKCEICGNEFETKPNGNSRKYCFECSPSYPKGESRSKTISVLRRAMKKEAVKRHGGKCERCGYNKCIDALQFHHKDANKKEFGLANGITHSWEEYLAESMKCELLCANCHAEEHSKNNNIDR